MQGFLLVHKPRGITSFQVVRRIRQLTGVKRVGHAGTLDPFAEGLLILALGRAYTRQLDQFQALPKTYLVTAVFGLETDTLDCEGRVTFLKSISQLPVCLEDILPRFIGEQLQVPPMFSAKKIQGQKLYDLARKGVSVERKPCSVTVSEIAMVCGPTFWKPDSDSALLKQCQEGFGATDVSLPSYQIRIVCSKGTYIRSLVADIGKACNGVGAFSLELVRERIGPYSLADAIRYEDLSLEKIQSYTVCPHP